MIEYSEETKLEPMDVVMVVFTLGVYSNRDFASGPSLSFNAQDVVLLCRMKDNIPESGVAEDNGSLFPVTIPANVSSIAHFRRP